MLLELSLETQKIQLKLLPKHTSNKNWETYLPNLIGFNYNEKVSKEGQKVSAY